MTILFGVFMMAVVYAGKVYGIDINYPGHPKMLIIGNGAILLWLGVMILHIAFFAPRLKEAIRSWWFAQTGDTRQILDTLSKVLKPAPALDGTTGTGSVSLPAQESLPYLLGWLVQWLLHERWFVAILQAATALIYAACLIAFFSFQGENTQSPNGLLTKFQVGQPSAWFTLEGSKSGMHTKFEFVTVTHFVALLGLASLTIYRRLERRQSGKAHSMKWHYFVWGVFLIGSAGIGLFVLSGLLDQRL